MGSETLYLKILFVDYDERYAIIELIGEWNDAINNDIMLLKRDIVAIRDKPIISFNKCFTLLGSLKSVISEKCFSIFM